MNALAVIDETGAGVGVARLAPLHRISLRDYETVVAQRSESGPAVLLVHALGLDWRMWEQVMDQLTASPALDSA